MPRHDGAIAARSWTSTQVRPRRTRRDGDAARGCSGASCRCPRGSWASDRRVDRAQRQGTRACRSAGRGRRLRQSGRHRRQPGQGAETTARRATGAAGQRPRADLTGPRILDCAAGARHPRCARREPHRRSGARAFARDRPHPSRDATIAAADRQATYDPSSSNENVSAAYLREIRNRGDEHGGCECILLICNCRLRTSWRPEAATSRVRRSRRDRPSARTCRLWCWAGRVAPGVDRRCWFPG